MPGKSSIEWCTDTWNPTTGCTRVSAGCDHCYAFQLHDQRHAAWASGAWPDAPPQYHKPFTEVQLLPGRLDVPLRWTKPRRIFVDSMADLFHPDVPTDYLDRVFATMQAADWHTFQVLTKRPRRMARYLRDPDTRDRLRAIEQQLNIRKAGCVAVLERAWPLPNVWLGTSVEDQAADHRIEALAITPAAVRFLSCEPLIGPLSLDRWMLGPCPSCSVPHLGYCEDPKPLPIGWVIAGGESGPDHRPLDPAWVRLLRDQCGESGVPFFFKQHGGRTPKAGGRDLDGRTWDEMPAQGGSHAAR